MRKTSSLLAVLVLLMGPAAARPASPAQRIDRKVRRAIKHFPGTVYLFAKNLDSDESYGLRADERVRTASTIKLSIMVTAFAAVEQGGARWNEELTLRESEKISGSGVLHELSDGVKLPLGDLVRLMIVVSDNTATNLLIDRFTADAVNQQMDRLGLAETRCLRKVRGDGPASGWSQAGRQPENQKFGLGVSTSREMVALLEKLERGGVVSAPASKAMIEILKRQQLKDGIGRALGGLPVASKSGALDHLRSDAGIVYSSGGRIAMAVTVDDLPRVDYSPDNAGDLLISKLSQILMAELARR